MIKNDKILELTSKQKDIYSSLKDIGEEISAFYFEGLNIISGNSKIKSYLLAHVAREVDGCLRDFLVNNEVAVEKCEKCGQKINTLSHKQQICEALGVNEDNELAKEWFRVSKNFHEYAHRHGAYKDPRDPSLFLDIWNEYENILFKLVGSYLSLLNRVDKVLENEKPSKYIIGILPNLLKSEARFKYFFSNLHSEEWLLELYKLGYFNPINNPEPEEDLDNEGYFSIPHWTVFEYLIKIVEKGVSEESAKIINKILHDIINYSKPDGYRIDNYITDGKVIEIFSKLPINFIDDDFFIFLEKALNSKWAPDFISGEIERCLILRLVQENAKDLIIRLLSIILQYKESKKGLNNFESIMSDFWLKELFDKYSEKIINICGSDLLAVVESKIKSIKDNKKESFHYITIPSIDGHYDRHSTEYYVNQLVYLLRDILLNSQPEIVKSKITEYLKKEDIFQRISVYVIGVRFEELKDYLFNIDYNPIDKSFLKHELFELFTNNCKTINTSHLEKIIEWIESQEIIVPENKKDNKRDIELSTAYRKKEWLFSLLESGDEKIKALYKKYEEINPGQINHPGLNFWSESSWVEEKSPITKDRLTQLSNEEIAEYLKKFKGGSHWDGPTKQGLSDVLAASITENPKKFTSDLSPFLGVDILYVNSIIKSFQDAWKNKKIFDWDALFLFIENIINDDNFWELTYQKGEYNFKNWLLSSVAELIEVGTQSDENAFDINLLPKAIDILLIIANRSVSDLENINNDVVTSVLNSVKGKVYKSMIDCSLRNARVVADKESKEKWVSIIREHFDYIINNDDEQNVEFFTVCGEYLKNIYYLDSVWVVKNIKKIFPEKNDVYWEASFTGYLYYSLNKELTPIVINSGVYSRAIDYNLNGEYANKYLVQHICLFYTEGLEKLNNADSLIVKLLNKKNKKHISEVIWYFWSQRENISTKVRERIKPIWGYLINILKNDKEGESKEHLSNLSKWLSLVHDIDNDIFEWLKISARCFTKEYKASMFVEYLHQHSEKKPEVVGEIFVELLNSGVFPRFREEDIIGIVEELYNRGFNEIANLICNKYAENNIYFLRDVYNNNQ